jgi:hypothetical protein
MFTIEGTRKLYQPFEPLKVGMAVDPSVTLIGMVESFLYALRPPQFR